MIQNVRSGQALTAGLLNNIISQANGQDIPSNQNFVNTDKGTLFVNNHDYEVGGSEGSFNKFLECWIDNAPEISNRPNEYAKDADGNLIMKPYIFINLGSSKDEACDCIAVDNKAVTEIVLINENEEQDALLEDDFLKQDGYVQLGKIESDIAVYGQLYNLSKKEQNQNKFLGYVFAVSTVKDDIKERVKKQAKKSSDLSAVENISLITEKTILTTTTIEGVEYKGLVQNVIGSQNLFGSSNFNETPPDSSISNLMLSSIENAEGEYQISTDIETEDGTLSTKVENIKVTYRRLFNFDAAAQDFPNSTDNNADSESDESEDSIENYDLVARQISSDGSKYITYLSLSSLSNVISGLSDSAISGDSQVKEDEQKSITLSVDGDEKYYQLYNFNNGCANARLTSFYGADEQYEGETGNFYFNNVDILVRVRPNSSDATELQYLDFSTLSATTIPTDTEVFTKGEEEGIVEYPQKSIEIFNGCFEDGTPYKCLQLYRINQTSDVENEYKSVVIEHQGNDPDDREKPYTQSLLPEGYEFVVRSVVEGCQGGTIHYMPLSVGVVMPGVDTYDAVDRLSRSIEWTGCDSGKDYLRLYNFAWNYCVTEYQPNYEDEIQDDKFKLEDSDGILFRKSTVDDPENDNPELRYMTFKSLKNYINYEGDSNIVDDVDDDDKSESIERVYDEETHQEYFRLKDFKYRAGDIMLNGELESNSTTEFTDDDTHILVRQFDEYGHPVLKYAKLEISLPEINGGTDYSYEINELYEIVDYLSGEISAISGTCSCDLSGAWQQGADAEINYGSSIGDSYKYEAINLDNRTLYGCWKHDGSFIIQGGCLLIPDGSINVGTVDSTYIGDGCIGVGNINVRDSVYTQALTIGNTTITESQLQQLLALLN